LKPPRPARVLLALALSLVLADLAVNLFLIRDGIFLDRPLPPFGALTHPRQRARLERLLEAPRGAGEFDPELGWTWRPSGVSDDGLFVIDAMGARKGRREHGPRPAPGRRRVTTFGDSFTFGDEVPGDASFQWLLEGIAPELEVLNFGVGGYGTDQALLRYRRLGRDLGADVACMGILLENIGRNVNRYRPLWNTSTGLCVTKPRFVLATDGSLEVLPQPFGSRDELRTAILDGTVIDRIREHEYWLGPEVPTGRLSGLLRLLYGYLAYRERAVARLWKDPAGEPFQVTVALLETFHHEALADGARLAPILIFPSKEDLRRYALPGRPYWTGLMAELDRRGVPYIDLVTPLTERARELDEDPPAASLYYGGHLSRAGNAVVARVLLDWIRAHDP
jgi:hypothetical protein